MSFQEQVKDFFDEKQNSPTELLMKVTLTIIILLIALFFVLKILGLLIGALIYIAAIAVMISAIVFAYRAIIKHNERKR